MTQSTSNRRSARLPRVAAAALALLVFAAATTPARAGKLSWLDEVVQQAVREARVGGETALRGADESTTTATRLLLRESDESLSTLARQADDFAQTAGRAADEPAETALRTRFNRLVGSDPDMARTFSALAPAEKRLVVNMGETAQTLARRYPDEAETMIRRIGVEGMSAVRVYGADVAPVIAREGPETIGILRKTGRGGWAFFNEKVLPNKGKLAAAGVLGLFLANPEQFVDTAGRVTEYAVEQFARAGISLAGAVGGGAAAGLESAIGAKLAEYGINSELARRGGMIAAGLVAFLAVMVLIGMPVRWALRPFTWPFRMARRALLGNRSSTVKSPGVS